MSYRPSFAFPLALALMLAPVLAGGAPALAETAHYQAHLGPMPLDDLTKTVIAGVGQATATLDGRTMTVQGSFKDMPSNATEAHIFNSPVAGVPGKKILDLTVTKSTSGTVSGTYTLSAAQAKALRTGKLYIQINSEKAPPGYTWGPKGTLWGWLFPAHETVGQDVPQEGHWFIPQLDVPKN